MRPTAMQEALKHLKRNLLTGTQTLFQGAFGFPMNQLTSQPLPPAKFLKDQYNPAAHRAIQAVYLAGFISKESLTEIGETSDSALESASRYPGMLLLAADLDSASPSYTEIQKLTTAFNRATPAMPVTLLYRYNKGSRMALASCERFEYKQKRVGERIGKTAILMDINLQKPSHPHKQILSALKIAEMPKTAKEVESVLEHWRDRFRCRNTDFLLELAREWIEVNKAIPPIEKVEEIFGPQAITIIRNKSGWGCYYNFLKDSCRSSNILNTFDQLVSTKLKHHFDEFKNQHQTEPSIEQISSQIRNGDLPFLKIKQLHEFLPNFTELKPIESSNEKDNHEGLNLELIEHYAAVTNQAFNNTGTLEALYTRKAGKPIEENLPFTGKSLEEIEISENKVTSGDYDHLEICRYSVPKRDATRYHNFVFDRLIGKAGIEPTIGAIRSVDREGLLKKKGFGEKNIQPLSELQNEILLEIIRKAIYRKEVDHLTKQIPSADLDFEINERIIPPSWTTIIDLISYMRKPELGLSLHAHAVQSLSIAEFSNIKGVHQSTVTSFVRLKRLLPHLVKTYKLFAQRDREFESCLISNIDFAKKFGLPRRQITKHVFTEPETCQGLDNLICEFITSILAEPFFSPTKENKHRDVCLKALFLSRRGFTEDKWTLAEIGETKTITKKTVVRERIRQIQEEVDNKFLWHLPISPKKISNLFSGLSIEQISKKMPNLFRILHEDLKRFRRFIGFIAQDLNILLDVENTVLNHFFAATPGPISKPEVLKFLKEELTNNDDEELVDTRRLDEQAKNIYETLILRKILTEDNNDSVYPTNLRPKEAVAHVFANSPHPLTIQDGVKISKNSKEYPEAKKGLDTSAERQLINNNSYLFLSGTSDGNSLYKHVRYLPPKTNGEKLIRWLKEYIETQSSDRIDLWEAHQHFPAPAGFDYYAFRHYIREFALEEGFDLEWDGKSKVDNLKLKGSASKRITNKDRVHRLVKESPDGLTLEEIASEFHCHSQSLIGQGLSTLIDEGKVWKVSSRLYTTPEAFKSSFDADETEAFKKIKSCLNTLLQESNDSNRLLDASLFSQRLNNAQTVDFHKNLFISYARSAKGVYTSRSLISSSPIEYESIAHLFDYHLRREASKDEAIAKISKHILASDQALDEAYQAWLHRLKNNKLRAKKRSTKDSTDSSQNTSEIESAQKITPLIDFGRIAEETREFQSQKKTDKAAPKATNSEADKDPKHAREVVKSRSSVKPSKNGQLNTGTIKQAQSKASPQSDTKSSATKKKIAKKAATSKSTAKKKASKKATTPKTPTKKAPAKKATAKKATAKKATAKKATAKKATAKKAPAKKRAAQLAPANKQKVNKSAKKSPSGSVAKKSTNIDSTTKKKVAKKAATKKTATKKKVARKAAKKKVPAKKRSTRTSPKSKKAIAKKTPSEKTNQKRNKKEPAKKTPTKKTDAKKRVASSKQQNKKNPQKNEAPQKAKKPGLVKRFFNALKNI